MFFDNITKVFFLTGWAIPLIILAMVGNNPTTPITKLADTHIVAAANPTPTTTPIPSPTPSLSPTPSVTPTPTKTPNSPTPTKSEETTSSNPSSDTALDLMKQINDFRAGKGLPAFTTDGYTCAFAVTRAAEIVGNFSHEGFRNRIDNKTLPYPSFTGISENIAMNSDPNAVVQGWIDSPGHNENLSKPHAHACVAKNGNYYAFLSWNP